MPVVIQKRWLRFLWARYCNSFILCTCPSEWDPKSRAGAPEGGWGGPFYCSLIKAYHVRAGLEDQQPKPQAGEKRLLNPLVCSGT